MNQLPKNSSLVRAPFAVTLAWLIPGLGHIYLGHKTRGIIFLVTVTLTYWTGIAIGGVKTVNPYVPPYSAQTTKQLRQMEIRAEPKRSWWFVAQMLNGLYTTGAYAVGQAVSDFSADGRPRYLSWPSGDIGSVYTGIAGLLNLLIMIDALGRAEGIPGYVATPKRRATDTGPPDSNRGS